jgi:hypothetical protein
VGPPPALLPVTVATSELLVPNEMLELVGTVVIELPDGDKSIVPVKLIPANPFLVAHADLKWSCVTDV